MNKGMPGTAIWMSLPPTNPITVPQVNSEAIETTVH